VVEPVVRYNPQYFAVITDTKKIKQIPEKEEEQQEKEEDEQEKESNQMLQKLKMWYNEDKDKDSVEYTKK